MIFASFSALNKIKFEWEEKKKIIIIIIEFGQSSYNRNDFRRGSHTN